MFPFTPHEWIAADLKRFLTEVGVEDTDACLRWAFGDEYATMLLKDSDDAWNERHSDLFVMRGSDNVRESIKRVGKSYVQFLKLLKQRKGGKL